NRVDGQPTMYTTQGEGHPVYGGSESLQAPMVPPREREVPPPADHHFDQTPFGLGTALDVPLNQALWHMADPGICADIYRIHMEEQWTPDFRAWKRRIGRLQQVVDAEWHDYYETQRISQTRREAVDQRLRATNVLTRALNLCNEAP